MAAQKFKLLHLPFVLLILGGISVAITLFMGFALVLDVFAAIASVLILATVLLVGVPALLLASRAKKR
jgi:hypothetical protein